MKIKLNFRTDEPNLNGKIYPAEMFDKAMIEAIDKGLNLYLNYQELQPNEHMIGRVNSYENANGELSIGVDLFDNTQGNFAKNMLTHNLVQATVAGFGRLADGEMIDYIVSHCFLTNDVLPENE